MIWSGTLNAQDTCRHDLLEVLLEMVDLSPDTLPRYYLGQVPWLEYIAASVWLVVL